MKTICFKLKLNQRDRQTIDSWMAGLRWVWNEGLELLFELDMFTASYAGTVEGKKVYRRAPCCPIPWQYRRIDKSQPWGEGNIAPYTYFAHKRPYRQFCPLNQDYQEPRLDSPTNFSLAKYFAHKRHPDKEWLHQIPAWFIRGTCHSLAEAWERYKSGKGGKPKFKRKGDQTDTLIHEDGKTFEVKCLNDRDGLIKIPKIGWVRVKHLWNRWGDTPIKVVKITKEPDGYYLQLTGVFPEEAVKPKETSIGLAIPYEDGVLAVTDQGKQIMACPESPALERRRKKLEQKLARQVYLSKNWHKTKRKIARLHRLKARQAKAHNHKLSTFLVRTYGKIAVQDVKPGTIRRAKPKARAKTIDPIHFDPNGAERIAQANQQRTSLRVGNFIALIQQKSKRDGRTFAKISVKPSKTTNNEPATIASSIRQ